MTDFLPLGKLKPQLLRDFLSRHVVADPRVLVGPQIGEDAAAIDMGDRYLLLASDPITFIPDRIGWYAVQVNANDIAAMGGHPLYFLSTVLLPERTMTADMAEAIFADVADACRELGCTPVGGHTEVTSGIRSPHSFRYDGWGGRARPPRHVFRSASWGYAGSGSGDRDRSDRHLGT